MCIRDRNGSGDVSLADLDELITNVLQTTFGDANLDGRFDSSDLIQIFQAGEYEDDISNNSSWGSGDWNCDRDFDSADIIRAFQAGGYVVRAESGEASEIAASDLANRFAGDSAFPQSHDRTVAGSQTNGNENLLAKGQLAAR